MNREDKFEKIFIYSIGCIGLLGVLATIIALFITLKNPAVVIRFVEEYSDFPTATPVDVVLATKPLPTYTFYPTYTPLPTNTPWRAYMTPSTPHAETPSPTPTFGPSSAIVASTEELIVYENEMKENGDGSLFITFNDVNVDAKLVSGIISSPGYPNLEIKNLGVGDRVLYHGKTWYEIRIKSVWSEFLTGKGAADVIVVSF